MPDLLTDLARVRELMERADAEESAFLDAWAEYADACTTFLRTHAAGIEAMARDAAKLKQAEHDWMVLKEQYSALARALGFEGDAWFGDPLVGHAEIVARARTLAGSVK